MTKLHDRTFGQDEMDKERDTMLATRISALQFVRPEHLEISQDFEVDSSLVLAQRELKKLNAYKVAVIAAWRVPCRLLLIVCKR